MFDLGNILTSTQLIRGYRKILSELEREPQALLITQRNGAHMVLVNAEIFEELLEFRHSAQLVSELNKS
jgi:hypothetical protein